jgi:hypothetical protein
LKKYDPKNLVFLSGDVHLAEISKVTYTRKDETKHEWIEMTSSGLTHTCADNFINKILCPLMLQIFSKHRYEKNSFFIGTNFGVLEVQNKITNIDINDTDNGIIKNKMNNKINKRIKFKIKSIENTVNNNSKTMLQYELKLNNNKLNEKNEIINIEIPDFFRFSVKIIFFIHAFLFLLLSFIGFLIKKKFNRKKKNN